ncbi:MAG: maleamate amidohydrolase, partial [Glaciecola sp.]
MTELEDNYAAAYAGVLTPGQHPALLNVDVCRAYVEEGSPLYAGVESSLASISRLTAVSRTAGTPVYWTSVRYQPGGADGGRFYEKVPALEVFVEGNPLGDFTDVVAPSPGESVVVKQYPSAFFGTTLAEDLH